LFGSFHNITASTMLILYALRGPAGYKVPSSSMSKM
jgi:hypothetical protein